MSFESFRHVVGTLGLDHAPFGSRTTYRVGGTARLLITLNTLDELRSIAHELAMVDVPIFTLGKGSNTLVADSEFDGVVVVLGDEFASLEWTDGDDGVHVVAGAALGLPIAARRLADGGVSGFEWAVGVPGSFGGAVVMNAGGHGSDMAASVVSVDVWDLDRECVVRKTASDLGFGYRHSDLRPRDIVLSVTLRLQRGDAAMSLAAVRDIVRWRREHQPGGSNAGSVFTNPPDHAAGALIEGAGLKGYRRGSAFVSDKHANFIQVDDNGRANDVAGLIDEVRHAVRASFGVEMRTEIRRVGFDDGGAV